MIYNVHNNLSQVVRVVHIYEYDRMRARQALVSLQKLTKPEVLTQKS